MLVNSDGQRAEWLSSPVISSAQLEELAQSQFVLRVEGKHIGTGATWNVTGDAKITTDKDATRDPETPTHWLIPVTPLVPRPGRTGELTVTTTTGRVATVRWAERAGPMPPTSPSKSPDPARKGGP